MGTVWEEKPVGVRQFVTEPQYLGLAEEVYPEILRTLSTIFRGGYEEAVLCWGIGSGKSYLCSLALLYVLYRTLCLKDPQRYYRLAESSQIAIVNVGPTARVAEKVIFGEVRELVQRSPWFKEKYPPEARVRKELQFSKHVAVIPGNSSELFPLGLNVLAATMDEASFFVETLDGNREAAEEVYLALQRRVKSRFGDKGLMLIASSPRHQGDFITRKLAEAECNPTIYGSLKATWEVKPKDRYSGKTFEHEGLEVPVEFEREFKRNPQKAQRDLAARPGAAFAPFFVDMEALEEACLPPASAGGKVRTPPTGARGDGERRVERPGLAHPFDAEGRLWGWFRTHDGVGRYVHVDLGLKKDACGIAMAKVEMVKGMPVVTVELMAQIRAPRGGEVDFAGVRDLIFALRDRGFRLAQVSYDGWQSVDSLQILRRKGIPAERVAVDLEAYETLKEVVNDRRLRLYEFRPLLEECRRLESLKGKKVDHPPGGSKDVADAVAGAVSEALKGLRGSDEVHGRIV